MPAGVREVTPKVRLTILAATSVIAVAGGLRFPDTGVGAVDAGLAWVTLMVAAYSVPDLKNVKLVWLGPLIGFALGIGLLVAASTMAATAGLAFVGLITGLPLADGLLVVFGRLRHRCPLLAAGPDHLWHRLSLVGLGGDGGRAHYLGIEVGMVVLGVLVANQVVAPGPAVIVGIAVLLALVVVILVLRSPYESPAIGLPLGVAVGVVGVIVALCVLVTPAAIATWTAREPALAGQRAAQSALAQARNGNTVAATADFAAAETEFSRAQHDLSGRLVSIGLAYPILAPNLTAARTLVDVGVELAAKGQDVSLAGDRFRDRVRGGTVPVAQLASTIPQLQSALLTVDAANSRLDGLDSPYLVQPLRSAVDRLTTQLGSAQVQITSAVGIATNVPSMLGLNGPRRYFLAFQTDAEARATGGLIGLDGIMTADQGHLQLSALQNSGQLNSGGSPNRVLKAPADYVARYGALDPAYNWQMVNLSPDFPTVGSVITDLYPQSGGTPIDGVVAMDPQGLAAMMLLTGPVTVQGWPVPIDAANVSEIAQNQEYLAFSNDNAARQNFLTQLVHTVFDKLTGLTLNDPKTLIADLYSAVRHGHLMAYSASASEQAYLATLGMTDAVPPVASDALEVTTQNAGANKIDYYMHRSIDYSVHLDPEGAASAPSVAGISGSVTVLLDNAVPNVNLPSIITGPGPPELTIGSNRTFLTLYTPLRFSGASLGGQPIGLSSLPELGRTADSTYVDVPAGSTSTLKVKLAGAVHLLPGGWYRLDLSSQPLINPDKVSVDISLTSGWHVGGVQGAVRTSSSGAAVHLVSSSAQTVWVQVVRGG